MPTPTYCPRQCGAAAGMYAKASGATIGDQVKVAGEAARTCVLRNGGSLLDAELQALDSSARPMQQGRVLSSLPFALSKF